MMKRLLIISNNVLSETNNNGKTLLSFINWIENVEVSQLYLSGEVPKISGYNYFRISDINVIKGILNSDERGCCIQVSDEKHNAKEDYSMRKRIGRTDLTLLVRELLWKNNWKSPKLIMWLDNISPDAILFLAGDACFAYSICNFIQERYSSRLTIYVTDDYIMPRKKEGLLHKIHRKQIEKHMFSTLGKASCFCTISESMREAYKLKFGKDSFLAMNMTEDLKEDYDKKEYEIIFTYAGSFYYERYKVLEQIAKAIAIFNHSSEKKRAKLMMYSNTVPEKKILDRICLDGVSEYGGSLKKEELKIRLNSSDVLVFVETFEEEQIEKVMYSFSTKIPEYMSIGKPILAVGPQETGSMKYLNDVAICVHDLNVLNKNIIKLLDSIDKMKEYGIKARKKYCENHNKKKLQELFLKHVFSENSNSL